MTKIVIRKNLCYIEDEKDIEMIRLLDNELSYRVQGAEHTRAFKGYFRHGKYVKWDGIHRLLNYDMSFPCGLLSRVKDLYSSRNKQVEIIGQKQPSDNNSIDIIDKLKELNKEPYHYQLEILETIKKHDNGIIRGATGCGKTLISALMIAYFGKPAIIFVIGTDLLHQTYKFFKQIFGDDRVGIVGDGICEIKTINIVSVWTVGKALGLDDSSILLDDSDDEKNIDEDKYNQIKELLKISKVDIYDECHLAACETIQEISKYSNPEHVYGMSASPWRDDHKDLLIEAIFGPKIVELSASRLINEGYLAKPYIKFIKVPKLKEKIEKKYPVIYKKYIIENEERNELIINNAESLINKGYQVLILYSRINHGKLLYNKLKNIIPCVLLSGKDSSNIRNQAKADLESRKINCVIASTIFDIGVDLPSLSALIVAGGGKSSVRALQRIGRVIRKYPGKKRAAIIDFVDSAPYLTQHSAIRRQIYSFESEFEIH